MSSAPVIPKVPPRFRPCPMQATLAAPAEAKGVGVHSGRPATLRLIPADPNTGIVFVRTDLAGAPEMPARIENIKTESLVRMTVLHNREWRGEDPLRMGASVGMIEHLMASCAGLGVTNLRVELDGPECPIFDGSGEFYVRLIHEAGIAPQNAPMRRWRLRKPVGLVRDNVEIIALPAESTRYTFFAEFRHAGMKDQQATFELFADDFASEVAPARTFCFWKDIEMLLKAGLIKGGSTENAIVIKDAAPVKVGEDKTPQPDGEFNWRVPNELARHKMLDLIGDLSVLGGPVLALISARASGHATHQEFARMLAPELEPEG